MIGQIEEAEKSAKKSIEKMQLVITDKEFLKTLNEKLNQNILSQNIKFIICNAFDILQKNLV